MNPQIGQKVKASFVIEIDSVRKCSMKDGEIEVTGWIKDEKGTCLSLVSLPFSVCEIQPQPFPVLQDDCNHVKPCSICEALERDRRSK